MVLRSQSINLAVADGLLRSIVGVSWRVVAVALTFLACLPRELERPLFSVPRDREARANLFAYRCDPRRFIVISMTFAPPSHAGDAAFRLCRAQDQPFGARFSQLFFGSITPV